MLPALRVGQGIDVHPFSDDPDRRLVLGGVVIEGTGCGAGRPLDADAVAHAVADAVLGAAGLGDLGRHAPDTDPQWAGADSIGLLVGSWPWPRRPDGSRSTPTARWWPSGPAWRPTWSGWPSASVVRSGHR